MRVLFPNIEVYSLNSVSTRSRASRRKLFPSASAIGGSEETRQVLLKASKDMGEWEGERGHATGYGHSVVCSLACLRASVFGSVNNACAFPKNTSHRFVKLMSMTHTS